MKKNPELKDNDIQILLNKTSINKEVNIDMYFQIVNFKLLSKEHNLYICTLKDKKSTYNNFILKCATKLLKDSIIHVTKIRITLSNNNKIISCLNYENFGKINIEDIEEKNKKEKEKEEEIKQKEEREREILMEELNDETKLLLGNLKHEKRKKKYFFKSDMGNLKLINKKTNKEINLLPVNESPEKKDNLELGLDNIDNDDIFEEFEKKLSINDEKENKEKNDHDDKQEIENLFEGINVNELFKINKKRNNRYINSENKYQLIINLSPFNEGEPLYIKCINKQIVTKEQNHKYLIFIFRDCEGSEINAYVYGNDIVNINKKIVRNGIYVISKYLVKPKITSTFINNDYRLILNNDTKIQKMPQDSVFNEIHFHFLSIDELLYFKEGTIIDICGIIYDEGRIDIYKTRRGLQNIRNILICDTSNKKIYITLWEPHCNNDRIKYERGEILSIKYCKLIIFPEKVKKLSTISLSILQNSTSNYEKDLLLKEYYEKHKNINDFSYVSIPPDFKYLAQIKNEIIYNIKNQIANCKMPFLTKAYIDEISIDDNCIYNGCPFCKKKLKEIEDNEIDNVPNEIKFKCILCNKNFIRPKYIFKLSFRARDANAKVFFNMVGDEARKFLETEPDIVKVFLDEKNYTELRKIEDKVLFQEYIFIGKLESYPGYNGKIVNKARVESCEKAEGENLKRILQIIEEDD